jgi:hypothetical protein
MPDRHPERIVLTRLGKEQNFLFFKGSPFLRCIAHGVFSFAKNSIQLKKNGNREKVERRPV